jgi:outer membrane PBP1 activator LpoA protein
MTHQPFVLRILFAGSLLLACASSPKRAPERAQRVPDSPPEKAAALRSASGLHQEEDEQRWGIEAARARKQNAETPAQPTPASTSVTAPAPSPPR